VLPNLVLLYPGRRAVLTPYEPLCGQQPAGDVAQVFNRLDDPKSPGSGAFPTPADCNSAMHQIENLRYDQPADGACGRVDHAGANFSLNQACTSRFVEVRLAFAVADSLFIRVPSTEIKNVLFFRFTSNFASGISSQNFPMSQRSKNWTSFSTDSNFGNLLSLISLSLPGSHISSGQNQRLSTRLIDE